MRDRGPPGRSQEALRDAYHAMLAVHTRLARLEEKAFVTYTTHPNGDEQDTMVHVACFDVDPRNMTRDPSVPERTFHVKPPNGTPWEYHIEDRDMRNRHTNGQQHDPDSSDSDFYTPNARSHTGSPPHRVSYPEGTSHQAGGVWGSGYTPVTMAAFGNLSIADQLLDLSKSALVTPEGHAPRPATAEDMVHFWLLQRYNRTVGKTTYTADLRPTPDAWRAKCAVLIMHTDIGRGGAMAPAQLDYEMLTFNTLPLQHKLNAIRQVSDGGVRTRPGTTMELAEIYLCGHTQQYNAPLAIGAPLYWKQKYETWFKDCHNPTVRAEKCWCCR